LGNLEERPRFRVHRGLPELLGIHLAETLVALEARSRPRLLEGQPKEAVEILDRRLLAALVDDRRGTLGGGRDLFPLVIERGIVRALEECRAERHGRRTGDRHGVTVAVLARPDLDVITVDRGRRGDDRLTDLVVTDTTLVTTELRPQQLRQDGSRHATARDLAEERAVLRHGVEQLEQRRARDRRLRARNLHTRRLDPRPEEEVLELTLTHQILLDLALLHLEQRR